MIQDNRPKCYRCKCLYISAYGYSDYTIEGTDISCLHARFEQFPQDTDEGPMIAAAKNCPKYIEGEPFEDSPDSYNEDQLKDRQKEVGIVDP